MEQWWYVWSSILFCFCFCLLVFCLFICLKFLLVFHLSVIWWLQYPARAFYSMHVYAYNYTPKPATFPDLSPTLFFWNFPLCTLYLPHNFLGNQTFCRSWSHLITSHLISSLSRPLEIFEPLRFLSKSPTLFFHFPRLIVVSVFLESGLFGTRENEPSCGLQRGLDVGGESHLPFPRHHRESHVSFSASRDPRQQR